MSQISDDEDVPKGPDGDDGGDDGGDDSEEIEILDYEAADEAGVRLGKAKPPQPEEPEIDVDTDDFDVSTASSSRAASSADLDAARAHAQELREQLLRTAADFENFRKRIERDRVEERKQATSGLLRNLLPVLDTLHRAIGQAGTSDDAAVKAFADGMRLVESQLFDTLKAAGLEPVDTSGTFDPTVHEALMQETTTDAPHMSVLEVFEPGYRLGGRLLRPARVKVANNPAASEAGEPSEAGSETTH